MKSPVILRHAVFDDWCHLCGHRSDQNADVWWSENAEHDSRCYPKSDAAAGRYLRVCLTCAQAIAWHAKGVDTSPANIAE